MAEKRPKHGGKEADPSPKDETEMMEGDDSVEILEVVGVEEEAAPARKKERPVAPPAPEPEDSIPYSRQELYDMLLRKQAEFENAKKRLDRERDDARRRIWSDLMQRLLPILDNFDRALAESHGTSSDPFSQGVLLTIQQFRDTLAREGLEEIQALGEHFDPHVHEAVETKEVDGFEEGMILEELRKGYRYQGQLLRPALVRVSAKRGEP